MAVNTARRIPESDPDANPVVLGPNQWMDNHNHIWTFPTSGNSNVGSALSSGGNIYDQIARITAQNNTWSAQQAQKQMDYQTQANKIAMDFNASEAAKNRDWQKMMSDTAHQREVADLKAAGLNPILSASGGNGAAVTSGSQASGVSSAGSKGDTDTSGATALVSFLGSLLQSQSQLQAMQTSALSNLAVADKYTEMQRVTTDMTNKTSLGVAGISAGANIQSAQLYTAAQRYATDVGASTSRVVAAMQSAASQAVASIYANASRYGAELSHLSAMYSADTSYEIAKYQTERNYQLQSKLKNNELAFRDFEVRFNAQLQKELKQMGIDADINIKKEFPNLFEFYGQTLHSFSDQFSNMSFGDRIDLLAPGLGILGALGMFLGPQGFPMF